jgi:hypothetical protein
MEVISLETEFQSVLGTIRAFVQASPMREGDSRQQYEIPERIASFEGKLLLSFVENVDLVLNKAFSVNEKEPHEVIDRPTLLQLCDVTDVIIRSLYTWLVMATPKLVQSSRLRSKLRNAMFRSYCHFFPLVCMDKWGPFLKERLCWAFNYATETEETPLTVPGPNLPFFSRLGNTKIHRLKSKVLRGHKKGMVHLWTLLNGVKKGLPHLSDNYEKNALKKLRVQLSSENKTPSFLLDEVRRTVGEVFSGPPEILSEKIWEELRSPRPTPTSATFKSPRSNLGYFGEILDPVSLWEDCVLGYPQLNKMKYSPRFGVVEDFSSVEDPWDYISNTRRSWTMEGSDINYVEPKIVKEPLKMRVMTVGSSQFNSGWSGIQKYLWKRLQEYPQLQLTGRVVGTQDLRDLIGRCPYEGAGLDWVSGDYEAATNLMHMDATRVCVEASIPDLYLRTLVMKNLTGAEIFDPLTNEFYSQKNGQLMGSLFSFPYLCLINLSVFRYCWERYFGPTSIEDLPVLINGDDILFLSSPGMYDLWKTCTRQVGLVPSQGKNYKSGRFAIINSTLFYGESLEQLPYVNYSFITGVRKGNEVDDGDRLVSITPSALEPWEGLKKYDLWDSWHQAIFCCREKEIYRSRRPFRLGPNALGLEVPGWKGDRSGYVLSKELSFEFETVSPLFPECRRFHLSETILANAVGRPRSRDNGKDKWTKVPYRFYDRVYGSLFHRYLAQNTGSVVEWLLRKPIWVPRGSYIESFRGGKALSRGGSRSIDVSPSNDSEDCSTDIGSVERGEGIETRTRSGKLSQNAYPDPTNSMDCRIVVLDSEDYSEFFGEDIPVVSRSNYLGYVTHLPGLETGDRVDLTTSSRLYSLFLEAGVQPASCSGVARH